MDPFFQGHGDSRWVPRSLVLLFLHLLKCVFLYVPLLVIKGNRFHHCTCFPRGEEANAICLCHSATWVCLKLGRTQDSFLASFCVILVVKSTGCVTAENFSISVGPTLHMDNMSTL